MLPVQQPDRPPAAEGQYMVEPLERRTLFNSIVATPMPVRFYPPEQTAEFSDNAAGTDALQFQLFFEDVSPDTVIGNNEAIRVTGPNGYDVRATFLGGPPTTFQYKIDAPGGRWDPADNGAYEVTLVAGQVREEHAGSPGSLLDEHSIGAVSINISPDASDLATTIEMTAPPEVVGGERGTARVVVQNIGHEPYAGLPSISLALDGDNGEGSLATLGAKYGKLKLAPGQSRAFNFRFEYPARAQDVNVHVSAKVSRESAELDVTNNSAASNSIHLSASSMDLAAGLVHGPDTLVAGHTAKFAVRLTNRVAAGTVTQFRGVLELLPGTADAPALYTLNTSGRLNAGASRNVNFRLPVPSDLPAGAYHVKIHFVPLGIVIQPHPQDGVIDLPFAIA